jgi:hypothetical protein
MSASEDGVPVVETSEKKGRFKVKNVSIKVHKRAYNCGLA